MACAPFGGRVVEEVDDLRWSEFCIHAPKIARNL
jgi:hypothetical protein